MMKYVLGPVLLLAALAAGNPTILTIINEFGFDDSLGWVELYPKPEPGYVDMRGWLLTTSTSVCTLDCILPAYEFLVVDSASLAGGEYGQGTFRLDPAGDTIRIEPDPGHPEYGDEVLFPALPASWGRAPMPPDRGSASVHNEEPGIAQFINWYIDSTPTPGWHNDDYSTVTGTVTWAPGRNFRYVGVTVCGSTGRSTSYITTSGDTFRAMGLGAGTYEVEACGWPSREGVMYPDLVDVGYSQTVYGINMNFDPQGLEESRLPTAYSSQPTATILAGGSGVRRLASSVVHDAMGRRVRDPKPGVFFVRDEGRGTGDAGRMQKVILQR